MDFRVPCPPFDMGKYLFLFISSILMLSGCSPIVLDRMPCAGDLSLEPEIRQPLTLDRTYSLDITIDWYTEHDAASYLVKITGLYGDERIPSETYLTNEIIYDFDLTYLQEPRYPDRPYQFVLHRVGNMPKELTFPLSHFDYRTKEGTLEAVRLEIARTYGMYPDDPRFYYSQEIVLCSFRKNEVHLVETDPCNQPEKKYLFSRWRPKVYVD